MTDNDERKAGLMAERIMALVLPQTKDQAADGKRWVKTSSREVAAADLVVTKDGWVIKDRHGPAHRYVTDDERQSLGL